MKNFGFYSKSDDSRRVQNQFVYTEDSLFLYVFCFVSFFRVFIRRFQYILFEFVLKGNYSAFICNDSLFFAMFVAFGYKSIDKMFYRSATEKNHINLLQTK